MQLNHLWGQHQGGEYSIPQGTPSYLSTKVHSDPALASTEQCILASQQSCMAIQTLHQCASTKTQIYAPKSTIDFGIKSEPVKFDDVLQHTTPILATKTSPNHRFGSTGSSSRSSDSSVDFDHAGYRLNLLCQQDFSPVQVNCDQLLDDDQQLKASCLFAQHNNLPQNHDSTRSRLLINGNSNFLWLNSASNLETMCL